jgi:glycosyltransferase involved in cell wall biosynthesis
LITRLQNLFQKTRAAVTGTPAFVSRYQKLLESAGEPQAPEYDLVYVMAPAQYHGWILDAICREIDKYTDVRSAFVELGTVLPPARAYFYSHYGYLRDTVLRQPGVLNSKNLLFYTHPRDLWYSDDELIYVMNMADRVISMCSLFVPHLIDQGISPELVEVALVGADPESFQPHERGNGRIGFCSSWLPRKAGNRILDLVRSMPKQSFALCGRNWPEWDRFGELTSLPNFEYLDIPYSRYAEFYNSIDVFVSMSELEGGPVPLIEAAMSNVVPVCSNTGHAADIITHGENGYLFETAAPIAAVKDLIETAFKSTCDVRRTVEHLTWKRFSHQVQEIAGLRIRESQERHHPSEAA